MLIFFTNNYNCIFFNKKIELLNKELKPGHKILMVLSLVIFGSINLKSIILSEFCKTCLLGMVSCNSLDPKNT